MGVLMWHTTMSPDGFIAGPDDAMDWVFEYPGRSATVEEVIETTGALLAGRRSYDVGRRGGQHEAASKPYGGRWTGPMFVLTHEPPDAHEDPTIVLLGDGVRLFGGAGARRVNLERTDVAQSGQLTDLRFRVVQ
jgi:hypothetical protein